MSWSIKHLFGASSIIPTYSRHVFVRSLCVTKDVTKISIAPGPDFLLQNLRTAQSPKNVFRLVNEHYSIMNSKHVLQALRTIFDLQKQGSSDVSTKDILRHPDFNRLCKKLKSQSGVIELNETIEALKVISYVGVPTTSVIVQVLLQLVRENVNSLTLNHVMFLDFLLGNFQSCPLVDALKIALPLVFEIHLPMKMDRDNVAHLCEYLHYASRTKLSDATVDSILAALLDCRQEFDLKSAKSVIWSLTDMEPSDILEPLLRKAVNDMIIHCEDASYADLEITMSKLIGRYSKRFPFYYNEVFVDTCANYVIDRDLGFKYAVYALKRTGRICHFNKHLLDYMSRKVHEEPTNITNADPTDIYHVAVAVSLTDYRPTHWDTLRTLLQGVKNLAAENRKEIIWMRFAASLCLLDVYKIDVLTRALNPEFLQSVLTKGYLSDFQNYFVVWQCIKTKRPELLDILPSKFEPEHVMEHLRYSKEYPLEASLKHGFGGENFVKTDLYSKDGVLIDHAVLLRKGGYPIPFPESVKFIEDMENHPENTLVVILGLKPSSYTVNTKTLRGPVSLKIKILENAGHVVVPINLDSWEDLNEFEKIPYLMQKIKDRVGPELSLFENAL